MTLYKISIPYFMFYKYSSSIYARNVIVKEDRVVFDTNKKTCKLLKKDGVELIIVSSYVTTSKTLLQKNKGLVIGCVIFCFCLFLNNYRVSRINFNTTYVINENIKQEIKSDCNKFLCFDFYTKDLSKLSKELRLKYIDYQWISVDKSGSVINVTISDFDTSSKVEYDNVVGSIIAKKSGVISDCNVYNGALCVSEFDYVKKGDVLISSNRLENTDSEVKDNTKAVGNIYAYTYETTKIKVLKESSTTKPSGNINDYKKLVLFNKEINLLKNKEYEKYEKQEEVIFDFFGFIKLKKVVETENYDIINTYDKLEAIKKAKEMKTQEFKSNVTTDKEYICNMEVLEIVEGDTFFEINLLSKNYESIGMFVAD